MEKDLYINTTIIKKIWNSKNNKKYDDKFKEVKKDENVSDIKILKKNENDGEIDNDDNDIKSNEFIISTKPHENQNKEIQNYNCP